MFSVYIAVSGREGFTKKRCWRQDRESLLGWNSNVKNLSSLKNVVCVMMLMDVNQNKKIWRVVIGCIWARSLIARRFVKCFVWQLLTVISRRFRSICGEQFLGQIRRTLACWSTSFGRWREKPRLNLRSRRSIYVLVERWSWSWWLMGRVM